MTLRNSHALLPALIFLPLGLSGCHPSSFPDYPASYREFAYIANSGSNTVTVLDLVYLRTDRTLRVGENPVALAANPLRPEVYVVNAQASSAAGSFSVIDTNNNTVAATLPLRRNPTALSVDPSGHRAFVANADSASISVLDLGSPTTPNSTASSIPRRALATVQTAPHPTSALISPDGRTLVVTLPDSASVALYAAGPAVPPPHSPTQPVLSLRATFSGCPGATSPVILPDSSKAFIACPATNQVLALSLAAAPDTWTAKQNSGLLTDHALTLLDVGPDPVFLSLKPDGGEIFVSNSAAGSVSEISTQNNEVGNTFPIGELPTHGIVSADNSALWVSNSGGNSISLYSIDDGKLVSSIHTGNAPDALAFSADQHLLLAADRKSGDVALIRTSSRLGPGLFTLLPAGPNPSAIAIKANTVKP